MESWLNWQGDYDAEASEEEEELELWERVGAEPIQIVLRDATYLTVRGEVSVDPDSDDTEIAFIGDDDDVKVFTEVESLARYCRTANEHALVKLEWWSQLADEDEDDVFAPEVSYDLRKPSPEGASCCASSRCSADWTPTPTFSTGRASTATTGVRWSTRS